MAVEKHTFITNPVHLTFKLCYVCICVFHSEGLVEVHSEYKVQLGLVVGLTGHQGLDYTTDLAMSHPGVTREGDADQEGAEEEASMIMVLVRTICVFGV